VVRRDAGARARVLSAAALGTPTVLVLGIVVATLVDATGGASGQWIGLVLVAALLASFLLLYVPVRFGMRAEWRESLGRSGKDV
jgi:cation transporter-like permease